MAAIDKGEWPTKGPSNQGKMEQKKLEDRRVELGFRGALLVVFGGEK